MEIPEPKDMQTQEAWITMTAMHVRKANPAMKLCPSHSGWMKRTQNGKLRIDLLFSRTGEEFTAHSSNYSRRNSLDFHLQAQSRLLGTMKKVAVVRQDSPISDHDGVCYLHAGALEVVPAQNPVKVIGFVDSSCRQLRTQQPVIKGMAQILDTSEWEVLCRSCGVDSGADVIVPSCTVKFDDGKQIWEDVTFYTVFDPVISRKATVSIQAAERVPLTASGEKLFISTFRARIREVMDAYRDPSGMKVAELLDQDFREMRERASSEDDALCDDGDFFLEKAEVLSATLVALMSGLPMNESEYLNATLPVLLRNRTKHCSVAGLTIAALPDSVLKPHEVRIPRREARRMGLSIGDPVTVMRYPNTGIEMAEARVVGFIDVDAIYIQPQWWAERFAGDFDGDLIGFIPLGGLVDEDKINNAKSPKMKGSGSMTISEAVARSLYAKLIIPYADAVVTICAEHGRELTSARGLLQAVVDSVKHVVDLPSIPATLRSLGLPESARPSPVATVIRGRLGSVKKETALRYNALLSSMEGESSGLPFLRALEDEFAFILAPNRKYAEFCYSGDGGWLRKEYALALKVSGQGDLLNKQMNIEGIATIPNELVVPSRMGAIRETRNIMEACPSAVKTAREIVRLYGRWIEELKNNEVECAYAHLQKARDMVNADAVVGGMAMRYLFIALVYRTDPEIRLKSLKVLSYMPVKIGAYNLPEYIRRLGYERRFDVRVIATGERKEQYRAS